MVGRLAEVRWHWHSTLNTLVPLACIFSLHACYTRFGNVRVVQRASTVGVCVYIYMYIDFWTMDLDLARVKGKHSVSRSRRYQKYGSSNIGTRKDYISWCKKTPCYCSPIETKRQSIIPICPSLSFKFVERIKALHSRNEQCSSQVPGGSPRFPCFPAPELPRLLK